VCFVLETGIEQSLTAARLPPVENNLMTQALQ
jgi:hypothetical protein